MRTSFSGRTVIMVAHRLNTVIDCDQVGILCSIMPVSIVVHPDICFVFLLICIRFITRVYICVSFHVPVPVDVMISREEY